MMWKLSTIRLKKATGEGLWCLHKIQRKISAIFKCKILKLTSVLWWAQARLLCQLICQLCAQGRQSSSTPPTILNLARLSFFEWLTSSQDCKNLAGFSYLTIIITLSPQLVCRASWWGGHTAEYSPKSSHLQIKIPLFLHISTLGLFFPPETHS